MNYDRFLIWLMTKKNMRKNSARDTVSRLKRVLRIIDETSVNDTSIEKLNGTDEFAALSSSIKCQLKRSVTLYLEFYK